MPKARSTVRFQLPRAKSLSRLVAAASARSVAATSSTPSILSRSGSGEVPGRVADSSAVWKKRGGGFLLFLCIICCRYVVYGK